MSKTTEAKNYICVNCKLVTNHKQKRCIQCGCKTHEPTAADVTYPADTRHEAMTTEAKDKTDRREIKFRAWDSYHKDMITPWCELKETGHFWGEDTTNKPIYVESAAHVMQFTGFKDKNGRDVYEGDIFRIEENDEENTVIYVVVVWVQEWAMFTTLRIEDEYPAYLAEGADAIDETMFWTYTLEDIGSPKHYPCGNIYENPELLQP